MISFNARQANDLKKYRYLTSKIHDSRSLNLVIQAQLFKELNGILKELPREEANKLKNVDLSDISSSATSTKSLLRNANHLNDNLLNSPEELDIYQQDGQDDEKQAKPSN